MNCTEQRGCAASSPGCPSPRGQWNLGFGDPIRAVGTCLLPRPPTSRGRGICQPRWGGSFLSFSQARGGEWARFFRLNCHCFSSCLSGVNDSGFVPPAGVSANSDWMNPKTGIPFLSPQLPQILMEKENGVHVLASDRHPTTLQMGSLLRHPSKSFPPTMDSKAMAEPPRLTAAS